MLQQQLSQPFRIRSLLINSRTLLKV
ncbi:hypothetical protein NQ317_014706 [Molorchus minor]|uniref:Uncharacterized protein n=1 Tax=Molorchus minor TaxID=1323400 RepID=A0ABQ9JXP3_9CUCU|nr:hypothetical protein NQ317_014706 [Molorchus minor]